MMAVEIRMRPTADLRFVTRYTYLERSFERVVPGPTKMILQQKWVDPADAENFQWRDVPCVEAPE